MTAEHKSSLIEAGSPFPNGRVIINGSDIGITAHNDGTLIALTYDLTPPYDIGGPFDPLNLYHRTISLGHDAPVTGNLFKVHHGYRPHGDPIMITIPTLATWNALGQDVFAGLPTAGIELVQSTPELENERGEAHVVEFVANLRARRQLASSHPKLHLHDMFAHGRGTRSIEEREFTFFEQLNIVGDEISEHYGNAVQASYRARLGESFDMFTGFFPINLEDTLVQDCLHTLANDYTGLIGDMKAPSIPEEVLAQSRRVVTPYLKDTSTSAGGSRTEYYAEVMNRWRGTPWLPENYTPPEKKLIVAYTHEPARVRTRNATS